MHIVGTAGHVDHGKTALVKALTGTDTDRLPEEKRRGMTIELGFACMTSADGSQAGIIDVPGHERFIRNMVAGSWALHCVMLVVAADDGWMMQTEDHARVLSAMETPAVVVVVTKIDKVEASRAQHVADDACSRCQVLFGHTVVSVLVSAINHQGIEELRSAVFALLETTVDTRKFPCCLYVDRSFILAGTGAVVTGSLVGQAVQTGQSIRILPTGESAKIRSLQSHNTKLEQVQPCSRTAMTLQGLKNKDIPRGSCITTNPSLQAHKSLVALLVPIPSSNPVVSDATDSHTTAPTSKPTLRNHKQVEIAFGTWHGTALIHVPGQGNTIPSTISVLARVELDSPAPCFWGQRFVCMRPGGSDILCGGRFIWLDPLDMKSLKVLASSVACAQGLPPGVDSVERLELMIHGWSQLPGLAPDCIQIDGIDYTRTGSWHVRSSMLSELDAKILELASKPGGITVEELRSNNPLPGQIVTTGMRELIRRGLLVQTAQVLTTEVPGNKVLSAQASNFLELLRNAGLQGIELARMDKSQKILVRELTRETRIVVLDSSLVYPMETYRDLVAKVLTGKPKGSLFSIADAKNHLPLSRKYIIPLLNKMEEEGLVQRIGDARKVL